MGIIKAIKSAWIASTTAEKIDLVLGMICGFGGAAISGKVLKNLTPGMNRVERICASVTMGGISVALGEAATKAYQPYTEAIGKVADRARTEAPKEEEANG